ncbi:MAG: L-histidine N(alpha)-methyltransferase [Acidimicrobiales bacterium]|nr:L-histidine N(alpha)-methyltransferase [Acidimicrobiales bacterium]
MESDVRAGLTATPKSLPPVYFYDDRGSRLFDDITRLPEYYPTRCERAILDAHAKDIVTSTETEVLVELGAGTCDKSRLLLDAMASTGSLHGFVPLDVSDTTLWNAATALAHEYPGLAVHAVVGDFHRHLDRLPSDGRRLFAFLGGTIGNLDPEERQGFYRALRDVMADGDHLLLGTDLVKDRGRLVRAYDDAQGVTAEFNRNVLHVLNRELGADFDADRFAHVARWNEEDRRIEMWLRSERPQSVRIGDLDLELSFTEGEEMMTEISTKFSVAGLEAELAEGGFTVDAMWWSPGEEFLLTSAHPR